MRAPDIVAIGVGLSGVVLFMLELRIWDGDGDEPYWKTVLNGNLRGTLAMRLPAQMVILLAAVLTTREDVWLALLLIPLVMWWLLASRHYRARYRARAHPKPVGEPPSNVGSSDTSVGA